MVLDVDGTETFLTHTLASAEGMACVAIHGFVWSKGGDRSVYRNIYAMSKTPGAPVTTVTMRLPEALSPEAMERPEFAPVRSYHDSVNNVLDELTRRCIVQLEGALKTRITYAALDYVMDESDRLILLWPHDVRSLDVTKAGVLEVPVEREEEAAAAPPPPPPPPPPEATGTRRGGSSSSSSSGSSSGAQEEDFVTAKQRAFAEEAAREAAAGAEFAGLLGRRVGEGVRGAILLVDNDAPAVVVSARVLVEAGFAVHVLDDAARALALLRSTTFDAMLLARDLPGVTGIEAVKMLRAKETGMQVSRPGVSGRMAYHLTVVVFTALTSPEDLNLYRMVGFDGCVAKPVDPIGLLSTMSAAVPALAHMAAGGGGLQQRRRRPAPLLLQRLLR